MDEKKRIIEFDAAESVPVDGQLPIDSASQGTKKITPALLLKAITDLLGDEALETLAQTLTGAVNEVKGIADDAQDLAENISDEYSSTSAYAKGDYCIHNNTLYKCTTAIGSGGEAWNASHWSATKCDDELSELKQSLVNLGAIETATTDYGQNADIRYIKINNLITVTGWFIATSATSETITTNLPQLDIGGTHTFSVPYRTVNSGNIGIIWVGNSNNKLTIATWNHTGTIAVGDKIAFSFSYVTP